MDSSSMTNKTVSLRLDAFERLRRARLHPDESLTEVVLRAQWPDLGMTAGELRTVYAREGSLFSDETLDRIDEATSGDRPPNVNWTQA